MCLHLLLFLRLEMESYSDKSSVAIFFEEYQNQRKSLNPPSCFIDVNSKENGLIRKQSQPKCN
jgi:hypothetical protein